MSKVGRFSIWVIVAVVALVVIYLTIYNVIR